MSTGGQAAPEPPPGWTCDAALAALFTPPRPVWGRFEVCTTAEPMTTFGSGFAYSAVEFLEALDAFGTAGPYDRSRLAQLFGGRRARVVRGWKEEGGRFESVTLITPYPDPSLARLHDGTMMIRWISN